MAVYTTWSLNGFENDCCALHWLGFCKATNLVSSSTCWEFCFCCVWVKRAWMGLSRCLFCHQRYAVALLKSCSSVSSRQYENTDWYQLANTEKQSSVLKIRIYTFSTREWVCLDPAHIEGNGKVGVALIKQLQICSSSIMVCVTWNELDHMIETRYLHWIWEEKLLYILWSVVNFLIQFCLFNWCAHLMAMCCYSISHWLPASINYRSMWHQLLA